MHIDPVSRASLLVASLAVASGCGSVHGGVPTDASPMGGDAPAPPDAATVTCDLHVPGDQPTIEAAIVAAQTSSVICVAPGTYAEDLLIVSKDLTLYGTGGAAMTTVTGTGSTSVLQLDHSSAVIDGFTLQGGAGKAGEGGGVYANMGAPVFRNLIVRDNHIVATGGTNVAQGGGMYIFDTQARLENVQIVDNTLSSDYYARAAGIYMYWGTPSLNNVVVRGNTATRVGGQSFAGGVDLYGTATSIQTMTNVVVADNHADYGAGIFTNQGGNHVLTNVSVVGNQGMIGAGMYIESTMSPVLDNVIFANNTATTNGGGIYASGAAFAIANSALSGNSPNDFVGLTQPVGTAGNLGADPKFLNVAGLSSTWNLHLTSSSPCVNAGDPALTDPDASRSDMGAYGGPGAAGWH